MWPKRLQTLLFPLADLRPLWLAIDFCFLARLGFSPSVWFIVFLKGFYLGFYLKSVLAFVV
eukprot:c36099_g1_i1 orf=78-260(+)